MRENKRETVLSLEVMKLLWRRNCRCDHQIIEAEPGIFAPFIGDSPISELSRLSSLNCFTAVSHLEISKMVQQVTGRCQTSEELAELV